MIQPAENDKAIGSTTMGKIKQVVTGLVLAGMAGMAWSGSGLRWLDNAPARHYSEADWAALSAGANRALDEAADGETLTWSNPDSDAHGTLTPLSTWQQDGMQCRAMRVVNHAGKLQAQSTYDYCRRADGTWGLASGKVRQ
jgi:surface antigen